MTLNRLFGDYVAALGTGEAPRLHGELFEACHKASGYVRSCFPASHYVNGDLFEDAATDAFLKLTSPERARTIEPGRFGSYYNMAIKNAMIDAGRRNRRKTLSLDAIEIDVPTRDEPPPDNGLREKIVRRVEAMPDDTREVFIQRLEGLADGNGHYEHLAEQNGIPIGTVKSRLHSAHKRMEPLAEEAFTATAREIAGLAGLATELRARMGRSRG